MNGPGVATAREAVSEGQPGSVAIGDTTVAIRPTPAFRRMTIAAFAAVYVIWGSTYLGIYYAIRTIPVFVMGGARFLIAGLILIGAAMASGAARPSRRELWTAAVGGVLLLTLGNASVIWAETRVTTGTAALLVTTPLWMVLIEWGRGRRPTVGVVAGLLLGMLGIVTLVGPSRAGGAGVNPLAAVVLICGSLAWAAGSLYTRYAPAPRSPILATGLQMAFGGLALLATAAATGEFTHLSIREINTVSWAGFFYLIVFGSLVGYSAYIWLVRNVEPARVATYAFVNPLVAVTLGWAIAGESLTARTAVAAAAIIGAVALITMSPANSE
jgi:drug/metabolite transporter (DMT)-like permease